MISECDKISRLTTRTSKRILSGKTDKAPKSSKRRLDSNSESKSDLNFPKLTKEEVKRILKSEVDQYEKRSLIGELNYKKNMNSYRHIILNSTTTESNLEWILDLRNQKYSDFINLNTKAIICTEPSFYKKDHEKYMEKKLNEKKIINPISLKENIKDVFHLLQDRIGEKANINQIKFELNLRKYGKEKEGNSWKQVPFTPKSRLFSTYNNRKNSTEDGKNTQMKCENSNEKEKHEKKQKRKLNCFSYLENNYKKFMDNQKIGLLDDHLGEHKGMNPYSEKYRVKNAASIQHLLKAATNTQAAFQSGLRDY